MLVVTVWEVGLSAVRGNSDLQYYIFRIKSLDRILFSFHVIKDSALIMQLILYSVSLHSHRRDMFFCSGVKRCTGSMMSYKVARTLQVEIVTYFKSCNLLGIHPWCFLTGILRMPFYKGASDLTGTLGSCYLVSCITSHLISCFFPFPSP